MVENKKFETPILHQNVNIGHLNFYFWSDSQYKNWLNNLLKASTVTTLMPV